MPSPTVDGPGDEVADHHRLRPLHEFDEAVFSAVAGWHSPILDRTLPVLSEAASYSRLWMGTAAVIAAVGGQKGRRTAVAALGTVAATSALANLAIKGGARRRRPTVEVPESRRLEKPESSSFPSGHTASAAAFSGVVGREIPALWLPMNVLAAAVGFSRVYTGVHYPGDVAAGWLLGKSVAAGGRRVLHRYEASHVTDEE